MKLNWGHKLILVFLAFGGMIGYMVYRCSKTNSELVSKDYYKDELAYQQTIDGMNHSGALGSKTSVVQEENNIIIRLPQEMKHQAVKGEAFFYCAADARRDRRITLAPNDLGEQYISSRPFIPGSYNLKIGWTSNNRYYYVEQPITIR